MREILFKGKCEKEGDWHFGHLFQTDSGTICILEKYVPLKELNYFEVDPKTVCQYTGLTDKDGRKIFEGDIFYDQNRNSFSVGFINCSFIAIPIKEITKKIIGRKWLTEFVGLSGYIEVIGNTFDNPELIGE